MARVPLIIGLCLQQYEALYNWVFTFRVNFGREPRLPNDVALGVNPVSSGSKSYPAYVTNLRDRLSHAYRKVVEVSKRSAARNKQLYDSRARQATIQEGDLVLVRNLIIRGKHKPADR